MNVMVPETAPLNQADTFYPSHTNVTCLHNSQGDKSKTVQEDTGIWGMGNRY